MPNKLLIATNNRSKLMEMQHLFPTKKCIVDEDIRDIPEPFSTFRDNAFYKAKVLMQKHKMPVIADDSGLVCPAINGEPGVLSARYAGDHDDDANMELLIKRLKGKDHAAYFVSVLCYMKPNGEFYFFEGRIDGEIIDERHGTNGFGYDPIFYVKELGCTFAEMSLDEKSQYSHRAKAIQKLKDSKLL